MSTTLTPLADRTPDDLTIADLTALARFTGAMTDKQIQGIVGLHNGPLIRSALRDGLRGTLFTLQMRGVIALRTRVRDVPAPTRFTVDPEIAAFLTGTAA